jgi:TRAP-type transport system periplasmic protein
MSKIFNKLSLGTVFVAAGFMALTAIAQAANLKLAHFVSPKHPMHRVLMAPMAAEFNKMRAGKSTLKVYPAGALGKGPREQYNRAIKGVADITFGLQGYTSPQFPRTLLAELPGLDKNASGVTARMWSARAKLDADYKDVKLLALWVNDKSVLITREKQIKTMADLKGLKIRVPSKLAAGLVSAWGGVPQTMPVTKVYTSLQTGVIDGVFIGASAIRAFKLHEVGKYFTTGLPESFTAFYLVMNKNSWNGLSADDKKALTAVSGRKASMKAAAAYTKSGKGGLAAAKKAGRTIQALSPAAAKQFAAVATKYVAKVIADKEKAGIKAKAILAALKSAK